MFSNKVRALLACGALSALTVFGTTSAQSTAGTEPVLTGSFVQLNGQLLAMSPEQWVQELGHMRAIGMDTVILQYSRYGTTTYFPSATQVQEAPSADETRVQASPDESIGTLKWTAPSDVTTRYLRIEVRPNSREWTMVPEVRVFAGGENVALGKGYSLTPAPAGNYLDPSAASGGKLTDGFANFAWSDMVGWQNPGERVLITFDLGAEFLVEAVEVDFMRSEVSAVQLPESVGVGASVDGATYVTVGSAAWGERPVEAETEVRDPIANLIAAAEHHDMQVWLGLSLDPNYWQGVFDPAVSSEANIALMLELEERYGSSPAVVGYYLPEEIEDRSFNTERAHEAMILYLAAMVEAAHGQVGKPVMVAPYFGMNPDGDFYAAWWDKTLARAPVDVIAMQDGVGTRRTTAAQGVPVYRALQPVAAKHGVALWSDLEVFEQTHGWPVNDLAWQARPATIESVIEQLQLEAPFVEKFVVFDFTHYMSPRLGAAASQLYRGYQAYLEGLSP
ncbi:MAG: DUF4434 domain-containing protein [Trueperaceae bacterium]|nr:DUF4434 domain-containing protein [Trueperaceae bacterium]